MFGRVHDRVEASPSRAIPGRVASAIAGVAAVVLIAGCGGSYTQSDFIARADAICASALRQTRSITPTSALGEYAGAVLPIVESEAAQLHALKRPPQDARDKATLAQYLGALAQEVENYRKLAAAARRGDGQSVTDAEAALRSSPAASLATSYGLRACGTPGATSA
jgi:hypothetical protein